MYVPATLSLFPVFKSLMVALPFCLYLVAGGEVERDRVTVMAMKEGTGHNDHWVLYTTDESLHSTPGSGITLHVNQLEFK